jgi:arylsulfatase A
MVLPKQSSGLNYSNPYSLIMNRRRFLGAAATTTAGAILAKTMGQSALSQTTGQKPNIIHIAADDLGFQDLSCYGGTSAWTTPNLDALAAKGMRFKYCFSAPLCTPTRGELLTGRYPFRTGITALASSTSYLDPAKEVTLANMLKQAGYTTAVVGKWHLNSTSAEASSKSHITACGFDEQYCYRNYGCCIEYGTLPNDYTPDLHQAWALKYLEGRKGNTQPFFLYYAFGLVHEPFKPTPLNPTDTSTDVNHLYTYMVDYLDQLIGNLLQKLTDLGMDQNTVIIFIGDNGTNPKITSRLNSTNLRGGKGSLRDTGTWVPLIAYWPGVTTGNQVCEELLDTTDFYPTIATIASATLPSGVKIDGQSFVPQLQNPSTSGRAWVYSQLGTNYFIRNKKWKLTTAVSGSLTSTKLYDLTNSPFLETGVPVNGQSSEAAAARASLQSAVDTLRSS